MNLYTNSITVKSLVDEDYTYVSEGLDSAQLNSFHWQSIPVSDSTWVE